MASEPPQQRPVPGGGRPRPKPRAVKSLPRVRALYDYEAADVDEISIKEGETFELIQERESDLMRIQFIKLLLDHCFQTRLVGGWGKLMGNKDSSPAIMWRKFEKK